MKIEHRWFQEPRVIRENGDVVACYFCKKPCVVGEECPWCHCPSPGVDETIVKGL